MNIIFLTIGRFESINSRGIYPDLMREFKNNGHNVHIVSSYEKRQNKKTELLEDDGVKFLHVKIGNITKCGMIEKGVSTLLIESTYKKAIKKYFKDTKFDLVIYSTPPITFCNVVKYIKKRDGAKSYLLLKDIFPQNSVDLGILKKSGFKGLIYKYFRKKEKKLYALSDKIGCMSQANCDYIINHNAELSAHKVEICPNSAEYVDMSLSIEQRDEMRNKYELPLDKKIFVYGGNLGKPQCIPFIIECLKTQQDNEEAFFLIVGDGTDYIKLEQYVEEDKPKNVKLMKRLPKDDYDRMIAACDVGMIFLDYRFTIPNFPSRLLSYMQAGIPIFACTDKNTDVGKVITENGFGWWGASENAEDFSSTVKEILRADTSEMPAKMQEYFLENYTAKKSCGIIERMGENM